MAGISMGPKRETKTGTKRPSMGISEVSVGKNWWTSTDVFLFLRHKGRGEDVNASSDAWCTVGPNKLKRWSLEQRKVCCKAMQGDEVAHALKSLELPKRFQQSIFKSQVREGDCRVCDQILHNSMIVWWSGNRVVSQGFTLSVLRLQEAWGYVLMVIKLLTSSIWWGVHIWKTTQEICIKYCYLGTSKRS